MSKYEQYEPDIVGRKNIAGRQAAAGVTYRLAVPGDAEVIAALTAERLL